MHKTAIIILHFGKFKTTKDSLTSLKKKIGSNKLILINNDKEDISNLASIIPNTSLIQNDINLGFAKGVNLGIQIALKDKSIDNILLLNNDLTIDYGSLEILQIALFNSKNIAICSPLINHSEKLFDWGGKFNRFTGNVTHQNFEQKPKRIIEVDHVAGASMMIKRTLIDEIGLFDEQFFLYFEDLDYCLRAKQKGYSIIIHPEVVAKHKTSSGSTTLKRTYYQWQSHIKFILKYMPSTIYPTALLYDFFFYPLALFKALLLKSKEL